MSFSTCIISSDKNYVLSLFLATATECIFTIGAFKVKKNNTRIPSRCSHYRETKLKGRFKNF